MEEDNAAIKPLKGAWNTIGTDSTPQIKFDINIPQKVSFTVDFTIPEERKSNSQNADEVYYVFNVLQDRVEKHFNASAWSLLRELKKLEPLAGKTVEIVKKLVSGKQQYFVTDMTIQKVK
jgi:hypothetical protein